MSTSSQPDGSDLRAAVIGLGSMGGAMAATLVRAGWHVSGYDPSAAARRAAEQDGVHAHDSLGQLVGIPFLVLSLPSAAVVESVLPELLGGTGTRCVVDTTTSEPATSQRMATLASERGAAFCDAPVSGGNAGAAAGTLAAFVGGDERAIAAAQPLLVALTSGRWRHVGPVGSGNIVKLLNNALAATNLLAVAEASDVAAAHGIDLATALSAISGASGASTVSAVTFPEKILSGSFTTGFSLGLMARDVALACEVAQSCGASPQLFQQTNAAWQKAEATLGSQVDFVKATSTFTTATDALNPEHIRSSTTDLALDGARA